MSFSMAKRDIADVIKIKDLGIEIILGYPGEPNIITKVLIKEGQEGWSQRRRRHVTEHALFTWLIIH